MIFLILLQHKLCKGIHKSKKIWPRVEFFILTILAGLTLLCNQAHIYIRKVWHHQCHSFPPQSLTKLYKPLLWLYLQFNTLRRYSTDYSNLGDILTRKGQLPCKLSSGHTQSHCVSVFLLLKSLCPFPIAAYNILRSWIVITVVKIVFCILQGCSGLWIPDIVAVS